MPLALELAAARVGALSVEQIAERLSDSLRLLTGGGRMDPPKQQTLRGTMDWSYQLLAEPERKLFRRLSVFAGGWTLGATEAVGEGNGIDEENVLDLLSRVVDKSLVVAETGEKGGPRYRMLEPVRQYGRERLEASGEDEDARRRHAAFFLMLTQEAEPELRGHQQASWLDRLEAEHDNLRAALSWALDSEEAATALGLSVGLGEFWQIRGYLSEGRRWLEASLAISDESLESIRIKALIHGADMAWEQLDYERATTFSAEALALSRKLGNKAGSAAALYTLGSIALFQRRLEEASALLEEALALRRELDDKVSAAHALWSLAAVAVGRHDYGRAVTLHEESLALAQESQESLAAALSLGVGALAALGRGDDHRRVRRRCVEGMKLAYRLRHAHAIIFHLHISAMLASSQGLLVRSARLWGAAEALSVTIGISLSPLERHHYGPYLAAARAQLDEDAWEAALAAGRTMTLEEAVEYALSETRSEATTSKPDGPPTGEQPPNLTRREREVAALVAQGLTNRQIASELMVSEHTVATHVRNVLKKMGLHSRYQIASWLTEH
jgi:non-specific serine/threonine protein kinase